MYLFAIDTSYVSMVMLRSYSDNLLLEVYVTDRETLVSKFEVSVAAATIGSLRLLLLAHHTDLYAVKLIQMKHTSRADKYLKWYVRACG